MNAEAEAKERLARCGRNAYVIPGADRTGSAPSLRVLRAELMQQADEMGCGSTSRDRNAGSAGTHAGLVSACRG